MNNALPYIEENEPKIDTSIEVARLTRLIEAFDALYNTSEWKAINELHFSKELERVERLMATESKRLEINSAELYRLQGELKWAKRYSDFKVFVGQLQGRLSTLKKHE